MGRSIENNKDADATLKMCNLIYAFPVHIQTKQVDFIFSEQKLLAGHYIRFEFE